MSGLNIDETTEYIKSYKDKCLDWNISVDEKLKAIVEMTKRIPGEATEMITRFRDMIPFVSGKIHDSLINLLAKISRNPNIEEHERTMTAVSLYNHARLDLCFKCFEVIAMDQKVSAKYRVEACRYLFGADEFEYKSMAQECLMDILEDFSTTSEYRYSIIAGFISRKGVISYLNASKIRVPYDEDFVYGLQTSFFNEEKNGVRERILSGQHILQMELPTPEEKEEVGEKLLDIARNTSLTENARADAADVVMRLGTRIQSQKAREITIEIGKSSINVKNALPIARVNTFYNNSQNVHDENISRTLENFIEKMFKEDIRLMPYEDVETEVSNLVRSKKMEKNKNFLAYKALNRIFIDTATFTDKKVCLAEIFSCVWTRIKSYKGEEKEMLENRFVEELIDMGDTCSTGHSARFINVLSRVDPELNITISFESQIIANVAGRVNAKIRDIEDLDLKSSVDMGMFPEASKEDLIIYKKFMQDILDDINKEMQKEFVEEGYLSQKEFDLYFSKASSQWLSPGM